MANGCKYVFIYSSRGGSAGETSFKEIETLIFT